MTNDATVTDRDALGTIKIASEIVEVDLGKSLPDALRWYVERELR